MGIVNSHICSLFEQPYLFSESSQSNNIISFRTFDVIIAFFNYGIKNMIMKQKAMGFWSAYTMGNVLSFTFLQP